MLDNQWWCCMPDPESNVVKTLVSYYNTFLIEYYPRILWTALWLPAGLSAGLRQDLYMAQFRWSYDVVVIDPEDPPLEVVKFDDLALMLRLAAFSETEAAACPDGCTYPVWP